MIGVRRPGAAGDPATRPRPDASMSLLNNLVEHPIDEGYADAARHRDRPVGRRARSGRRLLVVVAFSSVGLLLAVAAAQHYRSAPEVDKQRDQLVARIQQADRRLEELRDNKGRLAAEVSGLQASGLDGSGGGAELQRRLDALQLEAGAVPVAGPGLKVVVDDAKDRTDEEGRILDVDLQQLVNGLWAAGAEAVSVNGHRLTSLTAIRGAGTAITVNYSSLTRPYTVLAIGDTDTMPARFAQSPGGQWMQQLVSNYAIRMTITSEGRLLVPGDPTRKLRYARVGGER